jgi:hypothetical protein
MPSDTEITKSFSEAAQKEIDALLKQFEEDFAKTIERISALDIDLSGLSRISNSSASSDDPRNIIASLINQQFKRQKTPLEREVNRYGSQFFADFIPVLLGTQTTGTSYNPAAQNPMRLSQSQSAGDIFSMLSRSHRNS